MRKGLDTLNKAKIDAKLLAATIALSICFMDQNDFAAILANNLIEFFHFFISRIAGRQRHWSLLRAAAASDQFFPFQWVSPI